MTPMWSRNMGRTLNFLLPDGWTEAGTHDFIVWVNHGGAHRECTGCWNSQNQYSTRADGVSPTFHAAEPLDLTMVEVIADGISPAATIEETYRWLKKTFPINTVNVVDTRTYSVSYDFRPGGYEDGVGGGWGSLWADLGDLRGDSDTSHWYGMVDSSVPHCYTDSGGNLHCAGGKGSLSGFVACGLVTAGSDSGGIVMAEEIGHNQGRPHTCCNDVGCDPEGGGIQHPEGVIGAYGLDLANPSTPVYLDPNTYRDVMTYCGPKWISDITYEALRESFRPSAIGQLSLQPATGIEQEYLIGSGKIIDGLVIMTHPFYRHMLPAGTSDETGQGSYSLELQNANGTPLFTRYFNTIKDLDDPISESIYFRQVVPWQPGTARIVVKRGQAVLRTIVVSVAHPAGDTAGA